MSFVVVVLFFLLFVLFFYVVMLLSKLEEKRGGAKSGTTSGQNQRGQLCLQFLEMIGFLLFVFLVFVGVLL